MRETDNFGDIKLNKKIIAALIDMGFEEPSPIQSQTIPLVLDKNDVIGQAQTGTGKTAAFGIPLIELIGDHRSVQALILTPTRELAIQVSEEIAKIAKYKRLKTLAVYGGQPIDRQIRSLKAGVQVVVSTPGRLLDHINRGTIKLNNVKIFVLDEADEMLDMGFIEDIETIFAHVPKETRQTLLFSATMPRPIMTLAEKYMKNPSIVTVSKEQLTVPLIDQCYYETKDKLEVLCRVMDLEGAVSTIIFCRTKKGVDDLVASLQARGYMAEGLHGDLTQAQRDRVMKRFRDNKLDILIATDVAARGIDIDHITHVVNFDVPQDPESYVHRIGRTGRAGKKGVAITFIEPREYRQLKAIERLVKTKIVARPVPSSADIAERYRESIKEQISNMLKNERYKDYIGIVKELSEQHDPINIAAAAIKLNQEGIFDKDIQEQPTSYNTGAPAGMVRLFFNVGRFQKLRPEDFVKAIAEEADIPGKLIGAIKIYEKFTFIEVPADCAERVLSVMHKSTLRGYKINVELARGR